MAGRIRNLLDEQNARTLFAGCVILAAMALIALIGPLVAPYRPEAMSFQPFLEPSAVHPMGTDELGRDFFSRVLSGGLPSLAFGIGAACISMVAGVILGAIPAYAGGWVDHLFSRFFEIVLTIPSFIFIILLMSVLQLTDLSFTMLVVGLTLWPQNAKIMRAQVLSLKHWPFIEAARGFGANPFWILLLHIIPNAIYPVISNSTLLVGAAILTEAGLSFLGLGDPKITSWGQLIYHGRPFLGTAWWISLFPGITIGVLVMAFLYIGDGLNKLLDPRNRLQGGEAVAVSVVVPTRLA